MPKTSDAQKDRRRTQILGAAATCFARKGFHATTMQDVFAEAGLSAGAVYSYFDSKDALISALTEASRDATEDWPRNPLALAAILSGLPKPSRQQVHQLDVRLWGEAVGNPQLREVYPRSRERLMAMLTPGVERPARARGIAPQALAELVIAVVAGCELRRAVEPQADISPVLDALEALLSAEPEP